MAAVMLTGPSLARAADFVFINPLGGDLNVSTNYSPAGTPGGSDSVRLLTRPDFSGIQTLYVAANQSIGRIEYGYDGQTILDAKLNFSTPYVLTLANGRLDFTAGMTETPHGQALTSLFLRAPIAGGSGLLKTGPGFVALSGNNTYTGGLMPYSSSSTYYAGTTIIGPGYGAGPRLPGGLSVGSDANLGAAGLGLNLIDDGTLRTTGSFTIDRPITVIGGGNIESFGDLVLTGAIGGTGGILAITRFTGGSVTIAGTVDNHVYTVVAKGAILNVTGQAGSLEVAGTLNLGTPTVGPAIDAVTVLNSKGGTINVYARTTNTRENLEGGMQISYGMTTLNLEPTVNAGIQVDTSLTRANRSTLFVRGRNLGNDSLAANRALITFSSTGGPATIGGGGTTATNDSIVPFIFGNANVTGGNSQVSVVDAGFVTKAFSLRPLDSGDYATALPNPQAPISTNNVRLTDGVFTQNTNVTVNSLLVRDTMAGSGNSGVGGTGTITVTSGAIAAVSDLSGEELFIDNPIQFGGAEGIVHTAPTADGHSQLTLRGAIGGTNGLTKSGNGDLNLENTASTYAGVTTINAGLVNYNGNVLSGQNGALGASTTDVIINAGGSGNQYVGLRANTPNSTFNRGIVVRQSGGANSLALLGTASGYGTSFTGPISIEGGFLNLLADLEPQVLTLSGNVTGPGGLQDLAIDAPLQQYVRLTGAASTYSGGTVIRAGRWEVGSNVALGSGTVYFDGNGTDDDAGQTGAIQAFGGARSLANPLVFRAAPIFSGADALAFTGGVDLGSVQRDVVVNTLADTSFSGVVSRGGLTKRGSGRLILSGANAHTGQTIVSAGTLRAANNDALGTAAGQESPAQATFLTDAGVLELGGGITIPETIFFGGTIGATSAPVTVAAPLGNLRSISGDNAINGAVAFDDLATVGVDAGGTLTLGGDTLDNTSAGDATLRKVGAGTLAVRNVRLPNLVVDAGTLRITPIGTPIGTSRVNTLTLAGGATLDLTNNTLVLDYDGASPQADAIASLLAGRIVTTIGTPGAAIGYAEASGLFPGATTDQSYAGQSFDLTTFILTQTLQGDANLDRVVGFDDLLALAQNYGGGGKVWLNGDFDYTGTVDFDDLLALAQNYGGTALTDVNVFTNADFAADWALARSMVPEPTMLAALGLLPLARRRR